MVVGYELPTTYYIPGHYFLLLKSGYLHSVQDVSFPVLLVLAGRRSMIDRLVCHHASQPPVLFPSFCLGSLPVLLSSHTSQQSTMLKPETNPPPTIELRRSGNRNPERDSCKSKDYNNTGISFDVLGGPFLPITTGTFTFSLPY